MNETKGKDYVRPKKDLKANNFETQFPEEVKKLENKPAAKVAMTSTSKKLQESI